MRQKLHVVKFGGSNLKKKNDFCKLLKVIRLYEAEAVNSIVIVISALYGVTDILVEAVEKAKTDEQSIGVLKAKLEDAHRRVIDHYIDDPGYGEDVINAVNERLDELEKNLRGIFCLGEIPDFVEDRVLSYGERLSSLVLTSLLDYNGFSVRESLPESMGLFTNGEFRNASVDFSLSEKEVKKELSGNYIYIVPGFYGISRDSRVTLLGRGGSDYTAASIARCIGAETVDLWKDVQGFMSADPKTVEHPQVIHRLAYDEAAELSYFGARILHPRTFEPVLEERIPIRIFNINDVSEKLSPVTVVVDKGEIKEDVIKSVTFSDDFGILKLHGPGVGMKPGVMARVTSALHEAGINIKSIITAQTCINILLSRSDLERSLDIVKHVGLMVVDEITALDDISLIAVVGEGILERAGIAARIFSAVSRHNINIRTISAGASQVAIYFIVDRQECTKAVESIHKEFFHEQRK